MRNGRILVGAVKYFFAVPFGIQEEPSHQLSRFLLKDKKDKSTILKVKNKRPFLPQIMKFDAALGAVR